MAHRAATARILLIDCGLMFPDADMHGIDLVLPDFTWLRENADRIDGVRRHPRPRGPRRRRCSTCCASCRFPIYGSALTLGLARNRIEEAGLLGRTELITGRRRRAAQDRAVRRRVHPGHPLGAPRPRHRRAHPAGRDPALRRLQARPHPGRRPAHRPRPHRRDRHDRGHPPAAGRLDQRRGARARAERDAASAPCCASSSPSSAGRRIITASFASHLHRIQQIADAAIATGRVVATLGLSMRKNVRLGPRPRAAAHPRRRRSSTSRTSTTTRPGEVCVISTGSQGEPMSALALLARGENRWRQGRRARHGDPVAATPSRATRATSTG